MGYVCDNHKSRKALWICADCDSLYCSECVDKRIVKQRGQKKTFYFCSKCNIEAEKLSSNPFNSLMEMWDNFFHRTFSRPAPKKNQKAGVSKHNDDDLPGRVDKLVEDGNIDDALYILEREQEALSSDLNLSERYYNILKLKDRTDGMLGHARAYLDLLAKGGTKKKLCEVYMECASKSSDFSASSSASFKIAGSMVETGNPKAAADVYLAFIKNNQDDPMVPKASFLAANIFNERLLDHQKAVEMLEGVIKKYPGHETATHARQYLGQIKR
jgi:hypothetical protein